MLVIYYIFLFSVLFFILLIAGIEVNTDRILPILFFNGDIFLVVRMEVFTGIFLHTSWAAENQFYF